MMKIQVRESFETPFTFGSSNITSSGVQRMVTSLSSAPSASFEPKKWAANDDDAMQVFGP